METKVCSRCKKELPKTIEYFRLRSENTKTHTSYCKQCEKEYKKEWYEKDRPRQLEMRRQNYRDNKEKYAEQAKKRQIEHREELSTYIKDYYQKNKERIRAVNKEWEKKNKEKHREYQRVYQSARREKKRNLDNGYYYTPEQWKLVQDFFDHSCVYCGEKVELTIDHFIPVALGGKTELKNIVPACLSCNQSKSGKHPMEWCDTTTYKYLSSLLAGAA